MFLSPQEKKNQEEQIKGAKKKFQNCQIRQFRGHKKEVHTVAWSAHGKLASGSVDQTVRVWDIERPNQREMEFRGHTSSVGQLCFDPTNPYQFATASADKTVRIWDIRSGKQVQKVTLTGENINIHWRPDGSHIIVGNKNDFISIIDAKTGNVMKNNKFNLEVNEVKWDNTGSLLMMTTGFGTVEVFKYDSIDLYDANKRFRSIQASSTNIYCIEFSPDGAHFAVGSADSIVSIWNLPDMICVHNISRLEYSVRTISFSYDGKYISHASEHPVIEISHVDSGKQIHEITTSSPINNTQTLSLEEPHPCSFSSRIHTSLNRKHPPNYQVDDSNKKWNSKTTIKKFSQQTHNKDKKTSPSHQLLLWHEEMESSDVINSVLQNLEEPNKLKQLISLVEQKNKDQQFLSSVQEEFQHAIVKLTLDDVIASSEDANLLIQRLLAFLSLPRSFFHRMEDYNMDIFPSFVPHTISLLVDLESHSAEKKHLQRLGKVFEKIIQIIKQSTKLKSFESIITVNNTLSAVIQIAINETGVQDLFTRLLVLWQKELATKIFVSAPEDKKSTNDLILLCQSILNHCVKFEDSKHLNRFLTTLFYLLKDPRNARAIMQNFPNSRLVSDYFDFMLKKLTCFTSEMETHKFFPLLKPIINSICHLTQLYAKNISISQCIDMVKGLSRASTALFRIPQTKDVINMYNGIGKGIAQIFASIPTTSLDMFLSDIQKIDNAARPGYAFCMSLVFGRFGSWKQSGQRISNLLPLLLKLLESLFDSLNQSNPLLLTYTHYPSADNVESQIECSESIQPNMTQSTQHNEAAPLIFNAFQRILIILSIGLASLLCDSTLSPLDFTTIEAFFWSHLINPQNTLLSYSLTADCLYLLFKFGTQAQRKQMIETCTELIGICVNNHYGVVPGNPRLPNVSYLIAQYELLCRYCNIGSRLFCLDADMVYEMIKKMNIQNDLMSLINIGIILRIVSETSDGLSVVMNKVPNIVKLMNETIRMATVYFEPVFILGKKIEHLPALCGLLSSCVEIVRYFGSHVSASILFQKCKPLINHYISNDLADQRSKPLASKNQRPMDSVAFLRTKIVQCVMECASICKTHEQDPSFRNVSVGLYKKCPSLRVTLLPIVQGVQNLNDMIDFEGSNAKCLLHCILSLEKQGEYLNEKKEATSSVNIALDMPFKVKNTTKKWKDTMEREIQSLSQVKIDKSLSQQVHQTEIYDVMKMLHSTMQKLQKGVIDIEDVKKHINLGDLDNLIKQK